MSETQTPTTFDQPREASAIDMAFGGGSMRDWMPAYQDIPTEFRNGRTMWHKFQADWFYLGLENTDGLIAKEGIDKAAALRHLRTIQGSFEPKHEHKEAGVAYLASKWFTPESTWVAKKHERSTR
jgi:hypothetical protein